VESDLSALSRVFALHLASVYRAARRGRIRGQAWERLAEKYY
jgi:hypothetical protein